MAILGGAFIGFSVILYGIFQQTLLAGLSLVIGFVIVAVLPNIRHKHKKTQGGKSSMSGIGREVAYVSKIFYALLFFCALFFLSGCREDEKVERMENVVRVFWHEGAHYSVMVRQPNSTRLHIIRLSPIWESLEKRGVRIFADVPLKDPMWAEVKWRGCCLSDLEIHTHSEKNIEGGGWDHGKFGRGTTTVIR